MRLASSDTWTKNGTGLTFLFPHAGSGHCLSKQTKLEFTAGDVILLNNTSQEAQIIPHQAGLTFWSFSLCLEHLFPLFASREIGLLESLTQELKHLKHYPHTGKVARECHVRLRDVPPQFSLDHRSQLLQVAAAVFSFEFQNAKQMRIGSFRVEERMSKMFEQLTVTQIYSMSVDELASRIGCSRRHLNRLFHRHLGVSISTLRMEMRLLKAVSLLRNPDCKVINVAEECGFNHLGLFNTCFKKRFGVTPGQWRDTERNAGHKPEERTNGGALCPLRTNGMCPWTGVEEGSSTLEFPCNNSGQAGSGSTLKMRVSVAKAGAAAETSHASLAVLGNAEKGAKAGQLSRGTP